MNVDMNVDLELIGRGLGTRLNTLGAVLDRFDSFVFRPGQAEPDSGAPAGEQADQVACALVLRALRAAFDPSGWAVLTVVANDDATTAQIASALSTPRMVAWEQVNDLVAVGLVGRELERDLVRITDAGRGLVKLVRRLARAAAEAVTP